MARIAMTTFRTFAYGASRMAMHYATALTAAGHDVTLLYQHGSDATSKNGSILPDLEAAGVSTRQVPGIKRAFLPWKGAELTAAVRECGAELLITCQVGDAAGGTRVAKRLGIPSVVYALNMMRFSDRQPVKWMKESIYASACRRASLVVCCAPAIRDIMTDEYGIPAEKTRVVLNGLDTSAFPPPEPGVRESVRAEFGLEEGELLLLNLARMHPQKALPDLVEAARLLAADDNVPPFKLVIAGDATDAADRAVKAALIKQIEDAGMSDCVLLPGFRTDGPRLLYGADLFVLSSAWEGLPLVVLEAFGAALPVVMTEYGERFEGFRNGADGWYTPVGNPRKLADTIAAAMKLSEQQRREVGEAGRVYMQSHLTLEEGKRQFVEAVEACLPATAPAGAAA